MAIVVDVQKWCVFKANEGQLKDGHDAAKCPQCQALRRLVIEINNRTLDSIIDALGRMDGGTMVEVKSAKAAIEGLKVKG